MCWFDNDVCYVRFVVSSIDFDPSEHFQCCQNNAVDYIQDISMVALCFRLQSCKQFQMTLHGTRKGYMLSISSLVSCRYLSHPWRYNWQKRMLVMCISRTSGYHTLQTEAPPVL